MALFRNGNNSRKMKTKSYKEDLLKELKDPEYASAYLAQALESEDQSVFLLALRDVVEAGGGASAVARQARIQRESLYKALSSRGNPRLTTLQGILKSVGLRIAVTPETETS
jgi:probable addiction module antidote protein